MVFNSGIAEVTFRIAKKIDASVFSEKKIIIHNPDSSSGATNTGTTQTGSTSTGAANAETTSTDVFIPEPIITIQSGLDSNFHCTKSDCIANLSGESSFFGTNMSHFLCHWTFSGATTASASDSCNPGYVHYGLGTFPITLRITEKTSLYRFQETTIFIHNNASPIGFSPSG